jgi:hypothetical protein
LRKKVSYIGISSTCRVLHKNLACGTDLVFTSHNKIVNQQKLEKHEKVINGRSNVRGSVILSKFCKSTKHWQS